MSVSSFEEIGFSDTESSSRLKANDPEPQDFVVVNHPPAVPATATSTNSHPPRRDSHSTVSTTASVFATRAFEVLNLRGADDSSCSVRSEDKEIADDDSLISYFDAIDLDGSTKKYCLRCTAFNDEDNVICIGCGLALVPNPCPNVDLQISLNLKRKEDDEASRKVLERERLRHGLRSKSLEVRTQVLVDDLQQVCTSSPNRGGRQLEFLPKSQFFFWCSQFIKSVDESSFDGGIGYFHCLRDAEDVGRNGFGFIEVEKEPRPLVCLEMIHEDQESTEPNNISYRRCLYCWMLAYNRKGLNENTLIEPQNYIPLFRFQAETYAHAVSLQGQLSLVLADYFQTNWDATYIAQTNDGSRMEENSGFSSFTPPEEAGRSPTDKTKTQPPLLQPRSWPVPRSWPGVKNYVQPTEKDVIFDGGRRFHKHPGNEVYLKELKGLKPIYKMGNKQRQVGLVLMLLHTIKHKFGGRFLKMDHDGKFYEVTDEIASRRATCDLCYEYTPKREPVPWNERVKI